MFILKKGHQPGVYVPLRALFLVFLEISGISLKLPYFSFSKAEMIQEKTRIFHFSRMFHERTFGFLLTSHSF